MTVEAHLCFRVAVKSGIIISGLSVRRKAPVSWWLYFRVDERIIVDLNKRRCMALHVAIASGPNDMV